MSVISNARKHYREQLAGELKSIEVPEWDTTIYYKTLSNFVEEQKVIELHNKGELVAALVETLIQKALTAEGKKMFSNGDRDVLMREVDPNIIIRVCTEINANKNLGEESLGN
jgi:hypothetical protein